MNEAGYEVRRRTERPLPVKWADTAVVCGCEQELLAGAVRRGEGGGGAQDNQSFSQS